MSEAKYSAYVRARARDIVTASLPTPVRGPVPWDVCTCGARVWEHAGAEWKGGIKGKCKRYQLDTAWALAARAIEAIDQPVVATIRAHQDHQRAQARKGRGPRPAGTWGVSASDVTNCPAKIGFRENPPEGFVPDPEDKREAVLGGIIHDAAQAADELAHPWRDQEIRLTLPGLDAGLRVDVYDELTRTVDDYKCLALDTPVLMADGSEKAAGDVREGDQLVGWNEDTGQLEAAAVAWTGDNGVQPIYRITTAGGRVLRVTGNHPVLVGANANGRARTNRWIKAEAIVSGDRLVLALGWQGGPKAARLTAAKALAGTRPGRTPDLVRVTDVTIEAPEPTVGIEVAGIHTHVTAGLVTHNSAGSWKWDMIQPDGPTDDSWRQLQLYALALELAGRPVVLLRQIHIKRENGHEVVHERAYDRAEAEAALSYLLDLCTKLDLGIPLPRDPERTGPDKDPLCKRCFARSTCWDIPRAREAGVSPVSWVTLGPSPTEVEMADALADYIDAREAESQAKKAKEWALERVTGRPHGQYGDYEYGATYPRRPDTKTYIAELEQHYTEPDPIRPPLESIELRTVQNPSVKITKVPAATRQKRDKARLAAEAAAAKAAEAQALREDLSDPSDTTEEQP